MNEVKVYANEHFSAFVSDLEALVRIPSISFAGFPPEAVKASAQAVAGHLAEAGLENVEILTVPGAHPYVYADWLHAPGKPTLLLYAHHDVQPPGRAELWRSPPFEPTHRDGRLFGRGAADDKAGIIVHTAAIISYLRTRGRLPVNVKLVIEGEEETGSAHLATFLETYRARLDADVIVLTDTANFDTGVPSITTSLRGMIVCEVEVRVMDHSLHSGMWGGPIPDPVMALAKMVGALVDASGRIAVPGMYDDVRPLSKIEAHSFESLAYDEARFRRETMVNDGVALVGGEAAPAVKLWRLPALSVNAIQASSRKGAGNIINDSAWCRLSLRTVPDMDTTATARQLTDFLRAQAPWGVSVTLKCDENTSWWLTDSSHPVFAKALAALTEAFGREAVIIGAGGSIPFVMPFTQALGGVPALLIGVEDPYTNAHSENESVDLEDLRKSIIGAIGLYESLA